MRFTFDKHVFMTFFAHNGEDSPDDKMYINTRYAVSIRPGSPPNEDYSWVVTPYATYLVKGEPLELLKHMHCEANERF